ncbi:class I SAM-dependent methyltransferase [Paenimyroides tangerinum]|uniref:Class I SAM-dependent methyltransferase n=1 Tax=Paenimyroides tangerinum TaxID=2488728 RepID=A0A3P3W1H6_9FLAO|nr:class I SAM-dependent methyltransferase [Paenimyroides tangerinum]RRJ88901.1 class I SAM-dependent methyltransferase [Paenimyroides tangerinum]
MFHFNKKFIDVKDHSISKESFELFEDSEYELLKTNPFPVLSELGKYYESEDYISHTDGSRNLFEKVYQTVKKKTLNDKISWIKSFKKSTISILDIGCGTGDFLFRTKEEGWNVFGFEPNEKAKAISKSKNINLIDDLDSYQKHSFDVITMWHVLEHVPDLDKQIKQIKTLLKPDGLLIIAVPNYKSYDASFYKSDWAAYDVPRHLWHFSKTSIKKIFQNYQMQLIHIKPMYFDSFYVSLLSEKYRSGKMNLLRAFYIGVISNLKGKSTKEYSSHVYFLENLK